MYVTPLQDSEAYKFLREWSEINMGAEMTAESLQYVLIRTSAQSKWRGVVGWIVSTEFEMLRNAATIAPFDALCRMWLEWLTKGFRMAGPRTEIWTQDLECVTGMLPWIFISTSVLFDWLLIDRKKAGVYVCNADLTEARPYNHCCHANARSMKYSKCACVFLP